MPICAAFRYLTVTALVAVTLGLDAPVLGEAPRDLAQVQEAVQKELAGAIASTVTINSPLGWGSGVIIEAEGIILTAAHVCGRPRTPVTITLADGTELEGETLGTHLLGDIGVVSISEPGEYPSSPLTEAVNTQTTGSWCFAIGHPSGFDEARGPVLRVGKVIDQTLYRFRTDCELLSGDSGGPLFNLEGEVIGIHSHIGRSLDENFHGAVGIFRMNREELMSRRVLSVTREGRGGFLGITTEPHDDGVEITDLLEGCSAEIAGLLPGDIILKVDDGVIAGQLYFLDYMRMVAPGDKLKLLVSRTSSDDDDAESERRTLEFSVVLGDKPTRTR